jgi:hypothetical protein
VDEFADVLKMPVNARISHVGDRIDVVQGRHHLGTDDMARDLPTEFHVQIVDDVVRDFFENLDPDRALFASLEHAGEQLLLIKRLAATVPLGDAEFGAFDLLVGREALAAVEALATTPDAPAIFRKPGIDDFVLHVTALGTIHWVVV